MIELSKKQDDILANALALLANNGVDTSGMKTYVETDFRNTEAVAVFTHQPEIFEARRCRNCGKAFAHSQKIPAGSRVSFCDDFCRREDWRKTMFVDYDAVATGNWDGDPPLIINPEQFANLKRLADWFNKNQEVLEIAADRKTEEEPTEEESLEEEDPRTTPSPTQPLPATVSQETVFEPLPETSTDRNDTQTNDDSWLFG